MNKKFYLTFGALAPKPSEQINKQFPNNNVKKKDLKYIDKLCESLTHLSIHGIATECESERIRQRLMKYIKAKIQGEL